MKRHGLQTICFLLLASALTLGGCGGKRSKEALENELAYRQLGIQKMEEGAYEEAVTMFQSALDQSVAIIEELELDICYYKAVAQYKANDSAGALETCTALIAYDSNNAKAYYLRGTIYLDQERIKEACEDYQAAVEHDKKNGVLYHKTAENLINAGEQETAGTILNQALKLSGDGAADYREKGYACYLLGQYDSARTYLDKAVNMEDKEAVFYLAKMLEAQGETQQANQLYESYVGENGGDSETLNALGRIKMEEGDYAQALKFFQTALETENPPEEQELRKNEIAALEHMLNFTQAREKMKSYLADYPEDKEAAREYEFLQSR